jgi:hypothetical protein
MDEMDEMDETEEVYERIVRESVELGNRIASEEPDADMWDISDGLLAGAIHFWLYARHPCEDPMCEDCAPVATAEMRLQELKNMVDEMARESDYFHSTNDISVGHA